jgi:tRNA nucleotidyltransferase/poly(A) polymerase
MQSVHFVLAIKTLQVRFSEKLNAKMSEEIKTAILKQASLLGNVSAVRLYEECIKLFQNEYSFKVYEQLERYGLLKHLFKQTHKNDFIKKACNNTSERIKNALIFALSFSLKRTARIIRTGSSIKRFVASPII